MAEGLVADESIFKITISGLLLQQQLQTGFYLRDVGLNGMSAEDVVNAVDEWVNAKYRTIMSASFAFQRVEAVQMNTKEYSQKEYVNYVGTMGDGVGTTFIAANIGLRTKSRARYKNGRMFWPIVFKDWVVNGVFSGVRLPEIIGVADDFADRFTGSSLTHDLRAVVITKARPARTNRPELFHSWTDVEAVKVNPIATGIGRRRIGVGS